MPDGPARIRAVLFDLGGTLVDERDFAGWAELARGVYLDLVPDELGHAFTEVEAELDAAPLGLDPEASMVERWRRVLARASGRPVASETAARFLASRSLTREHPVALYSDVRRCLDHLRADRRRLAVVSNSTSEAQVRRILDRVGILRYFERVISSGTEGVAKPDPEIFRRALARLGVPPREALYVGNLPRTDALAARDAGLYGVWLHRDGTGLDDGPPEITSLLEVPLVVAQLEAPPGGPPHPGLK
ncbi:MAG TPA: HAD family hydrolase [Thermoplasmata archaeon]|nr:HAD family hydrolase [Thermoplasmata archaeon]